MVIDTSALLAILFAEPEEVVFKEVIAASADVRMSAASYMEAAMIVDRRLDAIHRSLLDRTLEDFEIRIESVTAEQARLARRAFQEFGKGPHPAGLNFGDCFSYALARERREPLLYKGNDFRKTDLEPAVTPLL
jgi:ribonuclease VapC